MLLVDWKHSVWIVYIIHPWCKLCTTDTISFCGNQNRVDLCVAAHPQTFQSDDHIHVAPPLCFSKHGAGPSAMSNCDFSQHKQYQRIGTFRMYSQNRALILWKHSQEKYVLLVHAATPSSKESGRPQKLVFCAPFLVAKKGGFSSFYN